MASRSFPAYRPDRDFPPAFGRNDGLEKRHCFLRRHEIRDELRPDWADIAPPKPRIQYTKMVGMSRKNRRICCGLPQLPPSLLPRLFPASPRLLQGGLHPPDVAAFPDASEPPLNPHPFSAPQ